MAFTLSLVSFSCTGPIIGFLLVQVSTTGNMIAPAIGMLGFAIAWHCRSLCCIVPVLAEVNAQIRRLDECNQGNAWIPGIGVCVEIPFRC